MIDDLLSLRALIVSSDDALCAAFRQAAPMLSVPVEMVEVSDAVGAGAACRAPYASVDLAYLDGALPPDELTRVLAAVGAAAKPPFSILLGTAATAGKIFVTDGLAGKPSRPQEAKWLLDRSIRVRLPSRVLVVDDSSTMRMIVRKTLAATRFQFDISEAEEGFAALKRVREDEFHIVFLDYNMPDFNGLETLAEFKREKRGATVVMITSTQDEELANRARALGAAFLKKPFYPADLEAVLAAFYGLRALNPARA